MTDYTKTTNFASKDALPSGNANKIVKGTEINTEFDNIATAVTTKANIANPAFTGVVSFPNGSASNPSITNTGDTNAGLFFSAADTLAFSAGGTAQVVFADGVISPVTDSDVDLGTNSLRFKDAYVDSVTVTGNGAITGDLDVDGTIEFDALSGTGSVAITDILDEDDMASNSATALATQQSIKAYVIAQQDTVDSLSEVLALGNTTGDTDISVTDDTKVQFRDSAIYINSSADGQLDIVADTEIQIAATTVDINGAINASGEIIAASLDISGDIDVDGTTNLDVVDIDGAVDMASTLQVDGAATFTTEITANAGIALPDSQKATFGAGDDLQIYHDGNHSYVKDAGTGRLYIQGTDGVRITNASAANMLSALSGDGVYAYHNANLRLATTSTGIDVTGTATMDGLTVDGDGTLQSNASSSVPTLTLKDTDTGISVGQSLGRLSFSSADATPDAAGERAYVRGYLIDGSNYGVDIGAMASGGSPTKRLTVSGSGNIQFFEDTGTTAKFFWDASAESLGIGTSSPEKLLHIKTAVNNTAFVRIESTATDSYPTLSLKNDAREYQLTAHGPLGDKFTIYDGTAGAHRFLIDSSGNVGIGTSSPREKIHLHGGINSTQVLMTGGGLNSEIYGGFVEGDGISGSGGALRLGVLDAGAERVGIEITAQGNEIIFDTAGAERMRIDSSGNLLVGTTNTAVYTTSNQTGLVYRADFGLLGVSRQNNYSGSFNRYGTDGDILNFRKDGTTVGSIGTVDGDFNVHASASGHKGLRFGNGFIAPTSNSTTIEDATTDLGLSTHRFKNLYLAGIIHGVQQTLTRDSGAPLELNRTTNDGELVYFKRQGTVRGSISISGSTTSYNTTSDYRLKENVVAMSGATERLKQLNPSRFNFIGNTDATVDGFLAHEVADVVPEAITGTKDAMINEEYEVTPAVLDKEGNVTTKAVTGTRSVPNYQGIDQSKLVPLLVATIQELEARITQLENN